MPHSEPSANIYDIEREKVPMVFFVDIGTLNLSRVNAAPQPAKN